MFWSSGSILGSLGGAAVDLELKNFHGLVISLHSEYFTINISVEAFTTKNNSEEVSYSIWNICSASESDFGANVTGLLFCTSATLGPSCDASTYS